MKIWRQLLRKRIVLTVWTLFLVFGFWIGSQNWYHIEFESSATIRTLQGTGFASWPVAGAFLGLSAIALLAIALLKGALRSIVALVFLAVSGVVVFGIPSALALPIAPKLAALIEKSTGITPVAPGAVSEAVTSITHNSFPQVFLGAAITLLAVQALTAFASLTWKTSIKKDKYSTARPSSAVTAVTEEPNGDNISLWDSQR